ncbi:MAG TPA: hypothetical protein VIY08_09070 [Candidatus Nitrosocosmicus sp.]
MKIEKIFYSIKKERHTVKTQFMISNHDLIHKVTEERTKTRLGYLQ